MSFEASAWALNCSRVGGTDKLVLIGIASHADKYGENAWPSVDTLAGYASVRRRAAQNSIAHLTEIGLISVVVNGGGNPKTPRDKRPNLYTLIGMHDGASGGVHVDTEPGARSDVAGCTPVPAGVHESAPELSFKGTEQSSEGADVPSDAVAPTVNQEAKRICDDYWKWYRSQHGGKDPIVGFNAYRNIVARALRAQHSAGAIKRALKAMHDKGIPLSNESIDRQLTRPDARSGQPGVLAQLSEIEFDDNGRMK